MSDKPPEPDDLRALGDRLQDMRRRETAKKRQAAPSPMGIAFRFATEMVSALLVGGGIGWGLDWLFGTRPIFLIVFFVLGAARGYPQCHARGKRVERTGGRGGEYPARAR